MGMWSAIGLLMAGSVLVYACIMCITPKDGDGDAHAGHGHGHH